MKLTRNVIFLGTPHRGGGKYADMGELARKLASVLLHSTNRSLLDSLGLRNDDLKRNQNRFSQIWDKYKFEVKTFQESLPLSSLDIPGLPLGQPVRRPPETLHL